jgi:hypothetical protein
MSNQGYETFENRTFQEIYPTENVFLSDVYSSPLRALELADLTTIYYLLMAKYGNSTIANSDEQQFKYKLYSIIYSFGPTWSKKMFIQKQLREMSEKDLLAGARAIYNHASNPGTEPSTLSLTELDAIDSQNTTTHRKSKMEAFAVLLSLLEEDLTGEFISKFKPLFIRVIVPQRPLIWDEEGNIWNG